jgi:tRNA (Thr-GGU) A37 N-methylase
LDGTPVLDVKPYIPESDSIPEATVPDWVKRIRE